MLYYYYGCGNHYYHHHDCYYYDDDDEKSHKWGKNNWNISSGRIYIRYSFAEVGEPSSVKNIELMFLSLISPTSANPLLTIPTAVLYYWLYRTTNTIVDISYFVLVLWSSTRVKLSGWKLGERFRKSFISWPSVRSFGRLVSHQCRCDKIVREQVVFAFYEIVFLHLLDSLSS